MPTFSLFIMKWDGFLLSGCFFAVCFCAHPAKAQLDVRLESARTTFLQYAPVPVVVRIKNIGVEEVRLRSLPGQPWMEFFVKSHDGLSVREQASLVPEDRSLKSGQSLRLEIDLAPHFLIREPGAYHIRLAVRGEQGDPWLTEPLEVAVARGQTLWSQERGLGTERRIFSLVRFYENPGLGLYLLVDLPGQQQFFPARRLGAYVPLTRPSAEFDSKNHLHCLFSIGSGQYRIVVANQNGDLLRQETRQEAPTAPILRLAPDGSVQVDGGMVILPQNLRQRLSYLQSRLGAAGPESAPAGP